VFLGRHAVDPELLGEARVTDFFNVRTIAMKEKRGREGDF